MLNTVITEQSVTENELQDKEAHIAPNHAYRQAAIQTYAISAETNRNIRKK